METGKYNTINFCLRIFMAMLLTILLTNDQSCGQVLDVKKWTGPYPEMNDSYPLSFIALKGDLLPVPYLFVQTWPTHYYVNTESLPVTDATMISGDMKTGLLRIVEKLLEQSWMKGRSEKTTSIRNHTELRDEIALKIFNTRFDHLGDLYQLSLKLTEAIEKVDRLGPMNDSSAIREAFEKEAEELCMRFLFINLLAAGHGQKMESFSEITRDVDQFLGVLDYTFRKLQFFKTFGQTASISYTFLTR